MLDREKATAPCHIPLTCAADNCLSSIHTLLPLTGSHLRGPTLVVLEGCSFLTSHFIFSLGQVLRRKSYPTHGWQEMPDTSHLEKLIDLIS